MRAKSLFSCFAFVFVFTLLGTRGFLLWWPSVAGLSSLLWSYLSNYLPYSPKDLGSESFQEKGEQGLFCGCFPVQMDNIFFSEPHDRWPAPWENIETSLRKYMLVTGGVPSLSQGAHLPQAAGEPPLKISGLTRRSLLAPGWITKCWNWTQVWLPATTKVKIMSQGL